MPIDPVEPLVLCLPQRGECLDEEGDLELGVDAVDRLGRDDWRRLGKDEAAIEERALDHFGCERWWRAAADLQREGIAGNARGRTLMDDSRLDSTSGL